MTTQIARIATTRLKRAPRPLRLCYAGEALRVKGSGMQPERQVGQVGAELIGSDAVAPDDDIAADVEVLAIAAEALAGLGIVGLSADIALPTLVPALCRALGLKPGAMQAVRDALDRKDAAATAAIGGRVCALLGGLLNAAGAAAKALPALSALDLPEEAAAERAHLIAVVERLRQVAPDLAVTVDPVENRGFEYHTGITFSVFARGIAAELGRGGRYYAGEAGEPATGFTLYTDAVLVAAPRLPAPRRLYLPAGSDHGLARRCRAEGWITVAALSPAADVGAEARRLGCSHRLAGDQIVPVG
jgi:ATP phosphoribosyltransferase regulatory subunit